MKKLIALVLTLMFTLTAAAAAGEQAHGEAGREGGSRDLVPA